eukprot:GHVQ01036764.1.p1 GENE.GHVQ01036764.1~~GHVQ01036764.1.p1  ORF type:complete len:120 (-),score=18.99 GHVQ01036764.1:464-823(-)
MDCDFLRICNRSFSSSQYIWKTSDTVRSGHKKGNKKNRTKPKTRNMICFPWPKSRGMSSFPVCYQMHFASPSAEEAADKEHGKTDEEGQTTSAEDLPSEEEDGETNNKDSETKTGLLTN